MKKQISIPKLKKKVQSKINSKIRERDKIDDHWICISCNKEVTYVHAGHYIPVKACSKLRYDPRNIHSQCARCNMIEGNSVGYRRGLIKKIGLKEVEKLEQEYLDDPNKRWSRGELNKILKNLK